MAAFALVFALVFAVGVWSPHSGRVASALSPCAELPFLHRCEFFIYPIALVLLAFVLSLPLNFNCTATVAYI